MSVFEKLGRPQVPGRMTPLVMGILNVTPDSFSDGGACVAAEGAPVDVAGAVAQAEAMVQDGADIIDIGGESTRPGAQPVPADVEMSRVLPVIEALVARSLPVVVSVDTSKASVACAALAVGAQIINDVSMLRDPEMAPVVARAGAALIIVHTQGDPLTMQDAPVYDDVVVDVCAALREAVGQAVACGVPHERIWVDPGLGFGKTFEHNIALLKHLDRIGALGHPVVLGASRKRFLGTITGHDDPRARDVATATVSAVVSHRAMAQIFRVHDVRATRDALAVVGALDGFVELGGSEPATFV